MEKAVFDFIKRLLEMNNIKLTRLGEAAADGDDFDIGLRRSLFGADSYAEEAQKMSESVPERTLLFQRDSFGCHYVMMKVPGQNEIWMIGPYLLEGYKEDTYRTFESSVSLPANMKDTYRKYLRSLPVPGRSVAFRNLIYLIASELFGGDDAYKEEFRRTEEKIPEYRQIEDKMHLVAQTEKRFKIMDELLRFVQQGNTERALKCLIRFRSINTGQRFQDGMRNARYWLTVFNTQLRTAAQAAGVHPYYLGETAENYAFRIEAMTTAKDYHRVMQEMIRTYCSLVNEQNLSAYPEPVQKTILMIRTGLSGNLTLNRLAKELNLNASYLSALFSREVGMSLTEYIHRCRIETSIQYMSDPKLAIKDIISEVGIYDLNYYSRLFKKYIGMTPTDYRKQMLEKRMELGVNREPK